MLRRHKDLNYRVYLFGKIEKHHGNIYRRTLAVSLRWKLASVFFSVFVDWSFFRKL
jgi:hypothetical protein